MSILKRAASAAMALALAAGMTVLPVSAASSAELENGDYTAEIHFHKEGTTAPSTSTYSMCDSIFVHEADVVLTDDSATVTFYVAYPIPSFPDQGADGTILDVVLTYDGTGYTAESDIETKAEKVFDTAGALFGINAGDVLPTQALTVTLPRAAVDSFEAGFATSAYVNSVMNTTQGFVINLTNIQAGPTETSEQSTQITADVAASAATYSVTIPESIAMGSLSAVDDNTKDYTVEVTAENLGTGKVRVATAAAGSLISGDNTLAFANSFGTQETSETASLAGTITVTAADVAAAAAGNYTGTANFSISYFAE